MMLILFEYLVQFTLVGCSLLVIYFIGLGAVIATIGAVNIVKRQIEELMERKQHED